MTDNKKIIWLDCDPGADDALGIILLCRSGVELAGIVSSYGNCESLNAAENASKILKLMGRKDIPVFLGMPQPLNRSFTASSRFNGEDGLCNSSLAPDLSLLRTENFVPALIETAKRSGEKVTYLATGPLTNLAYALWKNPEIKNYIEEIITASGNFGLTEYANRSEYNIELDPEAAMIVYSSGLPVRAVGVDVTRQMPNEYTNALLDFLPESPVRSFIENCTRYLKDNGLKIYMVLHDAMTGALLLDPSLALYKQGIVKIDPSAKGTDMMSFTEDKNGMISAAYIYNYQHFLELLKRSL